MSDRLNVLVLHRLGDPLTWRVSMAEKELCLPRFAQQHDYVVHDFNLPLPQWVKDAPFDAIVLTQTFLGARVDPEMRSRVESEFGDILRGPAFKIALPQDDYTCAHILDRWLHEWNVGLVYPACTENWDVLYPTYSKHGRFKQGYTGYVDDRLIDRTRSVRPMSDRKIDVAYRAARLSPVFGRLGQEKSEFGERFARAASGWSIRLDVSTRPQDTVLGDRWYEFIESTRCMLGVNSGSSLIDPLGLIAERVENYLLQHPDACYDDVATACFPGLDGQYEFTAISPRNLECALFRTVQILAPGSYGGFLHPWEHYLPLDVDMSGFPSIFPLIQDMNLLATMAARCRDAIISEKQLRYTWHVADLIDEISRCSRLTDAERRAGRPLIDRYRKGAQAAADRHWRRHRVISAARRGLGNLGLRRLKYWLRRHARRTDGIGAN